MSMIDYNAILKLNRVLTQSCGLNLEYIPEPRLGEPPIGPYTDGKTVYLPKPSPFWNKDQLVEWQDSNYHEVSHNLPENKKDFEILEYHKISTKTPFGLVLNVAVDHRVDKFRTQKYLGMHEAHQAHFPIVFRGVMNQDWNAVLNKDPTDVIPKVILSFMAFDGVIRSDWIPGCTGMYNNTIQVMDEQTKDYFNQLLEYQEEYSSIKTADESYNFVEKIFKEVYKLDPDKMGRNSATPQQQQGKGSKSKNENNKDGERKEIEDDGSDRFAKYEDILSSVHDSKGKTKSNLYLDYTDYKGNEKYSPHTDDTNKIIDVQNKKFPRNFDVYVHPNSRIVVQERIQKLNIQSLATQARRLLQTETRTRNYYNQKKGRLDSNKIVRVCLPENNSLSEKLFKTKQISNALDTCVSILVDMSGSMGGSKSITAIASAVALSEVLSSLRIKYEIAGFTEESQDLNYHLIFKNFEQPTSPSKLIEDMLIGKNVMHSNADADNILIAYHRLLCQKNKRKILIVLSDGSPASYRGDCNKFTKKVVSELEKDPNIDVIGIGILDNNVTRIYTNNKVVMQIEQLPQVLIETLETCILNKAKGI